MGDRRAGRGELGRRFRTLFDVGAVGHLADGELLDRFEAGRGEVAELAFAALLERHGPMVLRACRRVLGDAHEAEDAFQATFLVLARRARAVRRRDSIAGWLHAVAVRVAAGAREAAARRRARERAHAGARDGYAPPRADADLGAALDEELGRLPARFREVAVLCLLEGRSYEEASTRIGCPVGTVRSRLATARQRLRLRLERRGLAPAALGLASAAFLARAEAAGLPQALLESTGRAATRVAADPAAAFASGTVPAGVAALAEGVIHAMNLAKLKLAGATASALLVCLVGAAWGQTFGPSPGGAPHAERLDQLERKLDRVLEVLERHHAPAPGLAVEAVPAAEALTTTTAAPGASNGTPAADVAAAGLATGLGTRPWPANSDRLERRLEALERRVERLEALIQGDAPADVAPGR
jgi:RNA polymerase sigma-70 factor (ECF subfamily)